MRNRDIGNSTRGTIERLERQTQSLSGRCRGFRLCSHWRACVGDTERLSADTERQGLTQRVWELRRGQPG